MFIPLETRSPFLLTSLPPSLATLLYDLGRGVALWRRWLSGCGLSQPRRVGGSAEWLEGASVDLTVLEAAPVSHAVLKVSRTEIKLLSADAEGSWTRGASLLCKRGSEGENSPACLPCGPGGNVSSHTAVFYSCVPFSGL